MPTIAISVPSGSHHRAFLQPIRDLLIQRTDWQFLVISPGAPWADQLFPAASYPRERFAFVENADAPRVIRERKPALVLTTTTGLDPKDPPLLEAGKAAGATTATFVESWDNIWKMERVANGRGKPGQRIVLPDVLLVWNDIMQAHALRAFPAYRGQTSRTERSDPNTVSRGQTSTAKRSDPNTVSRGQTSRTERSDPNTNNRIFVTGSPRLDYFGPRYAAKLPSREEVFASLGLDPKKPLLHFATTELYDHGHVAKVIAEAKRRGDLPADLQLYASVHPGGNMERHAPWARQYGFTIKFSPGRRESAPHPDFRYNPTEEEMLCLVATFKYTDVMVNLSSTVALESCLADRPTICAFFGKPFDWWGWRRSMVVRDFHEHYADLVAGGPAHRNLGEGGGMSVARTPRALTRAIQEYLKDPAKDHAGRRRSAETIAGTLAGDAGDRVLSVLRSLPPPNNSPSPSRIHS